MTLFLPKSWLLPLCIAASLVVHCWLWYLLAALLPHNFTAPVSPPAAFVDVSLAGLPKPEPQTTPSTRHVATSTTEETSDAPAAPPPKAESAPLEEPDTPSRLSLTDETVVQQTVKPAAPLTAAQPQAVQNHLTRPENFLTNSYEKLTYKITLYGLPVGSAELEAENKNGTIFISLRVESNAAISAFYPVHNIVESRHVEGKFIMTRVQQNEGSFHSDEAFSINLGRKRVTWINHLTGRTRQVSVPTDEVLDTLSGIYRLRTRPLHTDTTETLHIFDSDMYAEVPVEICAHEELILPGLFKVDTVKISPRQITAGIFRRTGDITIWITNDTRKVPVKIITTVPLGKVTAELISAETN